MFFSYNSKFIFPQLEYKDISSNISIKIVLDDLRIAFDQFSCAEKNLESEYSLVYFFNFNHFLSYLPQMVPHLRKYQKDYGKPKQVFVFTVVEGTELMLDEFSKNGILDSIEKLKQQAGLKIIPVSDYVKHTIETVTKKKDLLEKPIYHGIDERVYYSTLVPKLNKDSFIFLTVGTNRYRKNLPFLIDTFLETFQNYSDQKVKLVINTDILDNLPRHPKLIYIKDLSKKDMGNLYRNSHAFVTATKCEGFGLPVLEAMACGTPVIAPYHSGIMSICTHSELFLVKTYIEQIPKEYYKEISYSRGSWYSIDRDSLKHNLLEVYETNPKENMKEFIAGLSCKILDRFSILNIVSQMYTDIGPITQLVAKNISKYNYLDRVYNGTSLLDTTRFYLKLFRYLENRKELLYIFKNTQRDIEIYKKYVDLYGGSISSSLDDLSYNYMILDFNYETIDSYIRPNKVVLDFIHLLSGNLFKNKDFFYIQLDNVVKYKGHYIGPYNKLMTIVETLEEIYNCTIVIDEGTCRLYRVEKKTN